MDLSKINSPSDNNSPSMPQSLPIRYTGNNTPHPAMTIMEYQQRMIAMEMQARVRNFAAAANSPGNPLGLSLPFSPFGPYAVPAGFGPFGSTCYPPRTMMFNRFMREELPKPQCSYIGLIAQAILSSPEKKMILSDIYGYILEHHAYFRTRAPGWKNSIRHNLSLNACFVKDGRSATGKGHFWAINPANVKDFQNHDYRRRKAQQKAHRMMGISDHRTEDEDSRSPSMSDEKLGDSELSVDIDCSPRTSPAVLEAVHPTIKKHRKGFDMESLLAPDSQKINAPALTPVGLRYAETTSLFSPMLIKPTACLPQPQIHHEIRSSLGSPFEHVFRGMRDNNAMHVNKTHT